MSPRAKHITIAVVVTIVTIATCAATIIFAPIATPIVAIIGGAIVTWSVNKAFDRATEHLNHQEIPTPELSRRAASEPLPHHHHIRTLSRHTDTTDAAGHHMIEDVHEVFEDEDIEEFPPPRPPTRRPGM